MRLGHRFRRRALDVLFNGEHWCRIEMNQHIESHLANLDKSSLDAVEVSGSGERGVGWRSFERLAYPGFDLCNPSTVGEYDVVLCEQVLEHVVDPSRAARTLHTLTRPGGELIVNTPFMFRVHQEPGDYWRFTPEGMRLLLDSAGFVDVETFSWGNRSCIKSDLLRWLPYNLLKTRFPTHWRAYRSWHSLRNEAEFPVVVWAYARRSNR
jgi:hypothetical protein